jgi:hypothetical protein
LWRRQILAIVTGLRRHPELSMPHVIYRDPSPFWVPFVTVAIIAAMVWGGIVWNDLDFVLATKSALGIAAALLIAVFLQGILYWKDQVTELRRDGSGIEARLMRWVGQAGRVKFAPSEASDWEVVAKSTQKEGEARQAGTLVFTVRGKVLRMSLSSPEILDLEALRAIDPGILGELSDYAPITTKPAAA